MGLYENDNGTLTRIAGGTLYSDAPIGSIYPFGGSTVPVGFLLCDGAAVSRTTYADLFAAIGTSFGAGNGSTTFNVPDLRDKFPEGASTTNALGTTKSAGLPNITGGRGPIGTNRASTGYSTSTGAFSTTAELDMAGITGNAGQRITLNFDASKSNAIYGNSDTVQPPAVCVNFIIKALQTALPADLDAGVDAKLAVANSYSTTETLTGGTWIDGKPIYRKVISGTIPNATGGKICDGVTGVDTLVSLNVTAVMNEGGNKVCYSPSYGAARTYWRGTDGSIMMENNADSWSYGLSCKAIIEYTKT